MKKKKKAPPTVVEKVCPSCGIKTKFFLSKSGSYKCFICGEKIKNK